MAKGRIKFAKKQVAPKEKKVEVVLGCDHCGKPFMISRVRTVCSAVCAAGDGISIGHRNGRWEFFCNEACAGR